MEFRKTLQELRNIRESQESNQVEEQATSQANGQDAGDAKRAEDRLQPKQSTEITR
jgi:hypothetical protein